MDTPAAGRRPFSFDKSMNDGYLSGLDDLVQPPSKIGVYELASNEQHQHLSEYRSSCYQRYFTIEQEQSPS